MANKRRRRNAAVEENGEEKASETNGVESTPDGTDLGAAVEWVRRALTPFSADDRKRIIRAAGQLMK